MQSRVPLGPGKFHVVVLVIINFGQPPEVVLFPEIWKFREFPVSLGIITPFRPLQDLKDGGGRCFHQPYVCFFVLRDIE